VPFTLVLENTEQKNINITENTQTKPNADKANNAKHSKTKLAWFSRPFTTLGQETRWTYSTMLQAHTGHFA